MVRRGVKRSEAHTEQLEWWLPRPAEAIPVAVGKVANWARREVGPIAEDARATSLDSLG